MSSSRPRRSGARPAPRRWRHQLQTPAVGEGEREQLRVASAVAAVAVPGSAAAAAAAAAAAVALAVAAPRGGAPVLVASADDAATLQSSRNAVEPSVPSLMPLLSLSTPQIENQKLGQRSPKRLLCEIRFFEFQFILPAW